MAGYGYPAPGGHPQINPAIQHWFSMADKDNSGKISALELQSVLANGQGQTFSLKAVNLLLGMFAKESKHSININEFQPLFEYVNNWLRVFKEYDHDNSGTIQEGELAAAFTQMGYRLSQDFISFLMSRGNAGQSGSFTVDEFIVLCVQIQQFTNEFRKRDTQMTGTISIGFEDFLKVALSCDV